MGRVTLDDTALDAMVKLAEGNIGAITVLGALYKDTPAIDPQSALGSLGPMLFMDDMGIYGSELWILFKYVCKQDTRLMVGLLRACQLGFVSEREIKTAISLQHKNTLNVLELVAKVEEELTEFQKAPVIQ
jgi:hypothetical protein